MGKKLDIKGQVFGNLKAIRDTGEKYRGRYIWEFECLLCGKKIKATAASVKHGDRKSCGCTKLKNLDIMPREEMLGLVDGTNVSKIASDFLQKNNTSGHTGVSLHKQRGRKDVYIAYIYFKGVRYHLGSYSEKSDAIKARETAEKKLYGDFLKWYSVNFPERWKKLNKKVPSKDSNPADKEN